MNPTRHPDVQRQRAEWFSDPPGPCVLHCLQGLVCHMVSAWSRRSRSLLLLHSPHILLAETLWQAGFDLTIQEHDPVLLDAARAAMDGKAEFMLAAPELLAADDCSFDYGIAFFSSFRDDPVPVLRELDRVLCGGAMVVFMNAWSLAALECRLRGSGRGCPAPPGMAWESPRRMRRLAREAFGPKPLAWGASLHGPRLAWSSDGLLSGLAGRVSPLPLGGIAALRVDFGPLFTGTPLLVPAVSPVPLAE